MGKQDNKGERRSSEPKEERREEAPKPRSRFNLPSIVEQSKLRKKRPYSVYDEVYCDKDRAAAVSIGDFDIKKSLNQKRRQDRTEALQVPEEQDPSNLIALGMREIKGKNLDNGVLLLKYVQLMQMP
uniref:CSON014370 protein n=1 Tax=Culicoides sonorensis TaxID=179676 RepID=A0A336MMS5_CULSO